MRDCVESQTAQCTLYNYGLRSYGLYSYGMHRIADGAVHRLAGGRRQELVRLRRPWLGRGLCSYGLYSYDPI